jgi:phosphohistidine phosphatase SixA
MGVHPFHDPAIRDEFATVPVPIDARDPHTYAAEWTPQRVAFYVDDNLVKVVRQSPAYPMQLMLDIIQRLDKEAGCVMLFGHNPELTELAHRLSSKITRMPTCAVAEFTFDGNSWSRVGKRSPATATVSYPPKK